MFSKKLTGVYCSRMHLKLPIKLVSPNVQEHWRKRHKRNKVIAFLVKALWKEKVKLPCEITITKVSPREFDFDNYVYACKGLRDQIADKLIPGLKPGIADGDKRLTWNYEQEKGKASENYVRVDIVST